jgi:hypothetical protein
MPGSRTDDVTLKIPRPLYERLRAVTEFCVYVLRDLAASGPSDDDSLTHEEVAAIRRRLRSLGYLED